MKQFLTYFLTLTIIFFLYSCNPTVETPIIGNTPPIDNEDDTPDEEEEEEETAETWELTFEDNFDGNAFDAPDASKWVSEEYNRRNNDNGPDGWWSKEDVYLDGEGNLIISLRQIPNQNGDSDAFDYSTGMVQTKGKFQQKFGKFEISCKLPEYSGWWIAFWLFTNSVGNVDGSGEDGTEIDIMEGFGWNNEINQALHYDGYGDAHESTGQKITMDGDHDAFHTYTLEWNENEYIFFIDDVETWRTSYGGVSKVAEHIIVSGEISSQDWAIGNWWSNEIVGDSYPDYFIVDYVRVYQKTE